MTQEETITNVEEEEKTSIRLISSRLYPEAKTLYTQNSLVEFNDWVSSVSEYELDIETNVVEDLTDREIYVIQFGSTDGKVQWVVDFASLPEEYRDYFATVLNDKSKLKIIHNAAFEYSVIRYCLGIDIDNIFDTMLALKVVTNGKTIPEHFYRLNVALETLFGIEMSKEEQTSFTGEQLSEAQILYAATDVMHMHKIRDRIISLDEYKNDKYAIMLENMVVRCYGDILSNGFCFNKDLWLENLKWAGDAAKIDLDKMYSIMRSDHLEACELLGFIQPEDQVVINWRSSQQKAEFLSRIYPELEKFTKPALKTYELLLSDENILIHLVNNDFEAATQYAMDHHRELLMELGYLKVKGEILINMNSSTQRLELFQLVKPDLQSTGEPALRHIRDPLIDAYKTYSKTSKLTTSYGKNWFEFIGRDGKIRPRYVDQILKTGRVSLSKPGIMTVPANEGDESKNELGDRYRRPFEAEPGWKICASDYSSQEIVIIAYLAQEEVWLSANEKGWDLHSVCASLVFKQKWLDAGGDPEGKVKPTTPEGKKLRTAVKEISFGLAFGGGPSLLAGKLRISVQEAKDLVEEYFAAFPKIRDYFNGRAELGLAQGYIETAAPFYRKRYFEEWKEDSMDRVVMGSIGRESKNTSVQGTAADGAKCAIVLIKAYIEEHKLQDRVKIVMALHDAIVTMVRDDFAEEWKPIKTRLMIEGHTKNIPGGIIGADTTLTNHWTK